MRVIALSTLKKFLEDHPDASQSALSWYSFVKKADWKTPVEVKNDFGDASILKDGRVVFNIGGNKYRLVVWINYSYKVVYIRFLGTHGEYDQIDAQTK